MKSTFINQGKANLLVYFSGWSGPGTETEHLIAPPDYDLLICCDYLDLNLDFDFSPYREIRLVAWSMGVWVAEQLMNEIPLISATAVNGTPFPCNENFGIPPALFQATLQGLNRTSRAKFERRMCADNRQLEIYQNLRDHRPLEKIRAELSALYQAQALSPPPKLNWTHALIGSKDRIFPPQNQLNYWQPPVHINLTEDGHYPFAALQYWEQLWS
ncbi:biotin synthesis protein BioG [Mesocricetibacter intestinalis]|uniref:Biotin synthesis protein BioG n=1 Tax=Mesocricetibacter intestinalis TaxID=1521930 RepID=A0A4R6VI38_9PAST|nr:pimeloyl-ACP methyl esterase BioG family protein [Mesocricetibacter intestinalis]TDQ58034.1 biotin synthesis protein BioG [Mesocricetibacter intestinalis]